MKRKISRMFEFEAGHHLPNHNGKCRSPHGHSYKLEVIVSGEVDEETGMIMDFSELKEIVNEHIIDVLDHIDLNLIFTNPTAEVMGKWIWDKLDYEIRVCHGEGSILDEIKLWETSGAYYSHSR